MPSLRAVARCSAPLLLAAVTLAAQPGPTARLQFPLAVGPTARYLVDAADRPVFLQGDAPWSLIVGITEDEAELYLADREAKGVNALIVNLVEHKFNGPANRRGDVPFTTAGDFATPSEAYFAHAGRVLRRAEARGMAVLLNPLYLGYKGLDEGWYQEAILNGAWKCRQYGRYVGKRYADFRNIVWTAGGDRLPGDARECVASVAAGIREVSDGALWTAHAEPNTPTMDAYEYVGLDLNATYSYQIVHEHLRRDRGRRPVMPFVLFESSYEGEHNASPVQIRRQAWWALLAGATGQFYGARPVWLFGSGWKEALQLPGALDLARFAALVRELPWWQLVPDENHLVVDGGLGELNGLDTLAAASTEDGRLLVAYAPSARTIGIDLRRLKSDRFAGYWWDPRTSARIPVTPLDGGRRVELKTPGDGDWALVLSAQ